MAKNNIKRDPLSDIATNLSPGDPQLIKRRTRQLMKRHGITTQRAAAIHNLSVRTIQRYLDESSPSMLPLDAMAQACARWGVSLDYIVGLSDEPYLK